MTWLSSAVHVAADGQVVAGQRAWVVAAVSPDGFEPSPMRYAGEDWLALAGTGMAPVDLVAATLREVAEEAHRVVGRWVDDVRLVVPAAWGPRRSGWLRQAARRAGFGDVTLVPAPVAVAQHVAATGAQLPVGSYLAVCDLGGGIEVSVLRRGPNGFELLSYPSSPEDQAAGGTQIDELLAARLNGHRPDVADVVDGGRWQRLAAVRAAKEAASVYPTVTVGDPPTVWTAGQVQEVARPVLERAARLTVEAIARADLVPDQLAGVFLAGGGASMPLAARVVGEAVGREPQVVVEPGVAAVRGAAQVTGPQGGGGPVGQGGPPLPPLRRALAVVVPGLTSLALLAVFLQVKKRAEPYNWFHLYKIPEWGGPGFYTRNPTWGALAMASTFILIAFLSAAALIASALPYALGPHAPKSSDGRQMGTGLLVAAGLGTAVAAVYAIGTSLYFEAPNGPLLRWAIAPIVPLLVVVVAVAALAARWERHPVEGWHDWLGFPVSSVLAAAVGIVLVDYAVNNVQEWAGLLGRLGGLLIGVGAALAVARPLLLRLLLAGPIGLAMAAITHFSTARVLAVIYIVAVTLWWVQRLWQLWTRPPERWLPHV